MNRLAGLFIFCLVSASIYAQENLNFNPKYKTISENESISKINDADLKEQKLKYKPAPGLKIRVANNMVKQLQTESDSLNQTPRKEEEITDKDGKK